MKKAEPPYGIIADGLRAGDVIPFFGAAASAIYRPTDEHWEPGKPFMPFGSELATTLAKSANYTGADETYKIVLSEILGELHKVGVVISAEQSEAALGPVLRKYIGGPPDLSFIASWTEHVQGSRKHVNRKLRQSFAVDCKPGLLHQKLTAIDCAKLYVTTNYDDLMELALAARQPHVIVDRGDKGLWVNTFGQPFQSAAATGGDLYSLLNDPATQQPSRPILFKMHGSVDKLSIRDDSYLITEEDYVDFLGRTRDSYIPPYINSLMEGKDFLFLGYNLSDWNVRVILRKLFKRSASEPIRCWAIVRGRAAEEQQVWHAQGLNIYAMDLLEFTDKLVEHL